MGSFYQWAKTRPVRRVTWICGTEPALAWEVWDAQRAGADEVISVNPVDDGEGDIWAALGQSSLTGSRFVSVRDAQKLRAWDNLAGLLSGPDSGVRVALVSSEADKDDEAEHLTQIGKSRHGQIVVCTPPSSDEALAAWVKARLPGEPGQGVIAAVLGQSGTDLAAAAAICDKLRLAFGRPDPKLAQLLGGEPAADFADTLLAGQRGRAAELAAGVGPGETLRVIGLLDSRLRMLAELREGKASGEGMAELARRGISPYLARRFGSVAEHYGRGRAARCRRLLAECDAAARSGAGAGVLEVLAALW